MAGSNSLDSLLDAEFAKAKDKIASFQAEQAREYHDKQQRLVEFENSIDPLREVIRPKLQLLANRFGSHVQTVPTISPGRRQVSFAFRSELATIELTFSVSPDSDVRNIIFSSDLTILPIFIQFDRHVEISFPLGNVDSKQLSDWLDERILHFVRTYFSMHENRQYWRDHLVRDPIAGIDFPRFAAAASLDHDGTTLYFSSLDTRDAYAEKHGIPHS